MTNVNEMSRESFGLAIADQISSARNKALSMGVTKESIEEVISNIYSKTQSYSVTTAARRIENAIKKLIDAASADTLVGVLVGSRDRAGSKAPVRYTLIKKDKQHVEVSNFGTTSQYQGEKIEIPVPAAVTIKARYDPEYDSWNLISIDSFKTLDKAALQKVLSQVVIPVASITAEMASKQGKSATPVVLHGNIGAIRTEPVFKPRSEEEDRKAEIDHYLPVYNPRATDKKGELLPCFQFRLVGKGHKANSVRAHLSPQKHGTPTVFITDIEGFCKEAVEKVSDPDQQADSLSEYLENMECFVVGPVSTFKPTYSEDKSLVNYIDIGVSCIIELDGIFVDGSVQNPLEKISGKPHMMVDTPPIAGKIESTPPAAASAPAPAPAPAPVTAPEMSQAAATNIPAPAPAPVAAAPAPAAQAPSSSTMTVESVAKMIKVFCRASGIKPSDMSLDMLKAKALDIVDGVPDAVVIEAMGMVKATAGA